MNLSSKNTKIKRCYGHMLSIPKNISVRRAFILGLWSGDQFKLSGQMPCGAIYDYAADTFPLVDTKCPCGDEGHWIVKWDENQ